MNRKFWLLTLDVSLAYAVFGQTWVASTGSDTNNCTRTSPCKTFQHAHDVAAPSGQVRALDAGEFGSLTITKAITIDGGGLASNAPTSGTAITINAGASDVVQLRNFSIHGRGATNGITYSTGAQLLIENVQINGFTSSCIEAVVTNSGTADMVVKDSSVENCGTGIFLSGVPATLTVEVINSHATFSHYGVYAYSGLVTITGSTFSSPGYGSPNVGIYQASHAPAEPNQQIILDNCRVSGYAYGIFSGGGTTQVSRSVIANNSIGVSATAPGSVLSNGNNSFFNNSSNGAFSATATLF